MNTHANNDTRQRLIDSASSLFYARSYGHVGVKEICDVAGVQKGSFYHFFPSKQELTIAVLDAFAADFKANVLDKAFRSNLSPLQQLLSIVEYLYQRQQQMYAQNCKVLGCPYGNIALELGAQDEAIRQHIDQKFQSFVATIQALLDAAVRNGEFAPCDTHATAMAMFSFIEGVLLMAKTSNNPELIRTMGQAIVNVRIESTTS